MLPKLQNKCISCILHKFFLYHSLFRCTLFIIRVCSLTRALSPALSPEFILILLYYNPIFSYFFATRSLYYFALLWRSIALTLPLLLACSLTFCCRHPLLAARSASLLFLRSLFGVALELRCHFCARFALYYSSIYFAYCIAVCFILCSLYFVYFFCTPFVVAFVPQVSDSGDFCFNIFPIAADCQTEESDKKKEMSAVAPCTHTHTYSDSCVCALLLLFNSFLLIGSTYNEIDNTHLHATLSGVCQLTQLQICSTCPAQSPRLTICCQLTHTHRNTHTQQCKLLGKHKRPAKRCI